jgi:hypothetical protein
MYDMMKKKVHCPEREPGSMGLRSDSPWFIEKVTIKINSLLQFKK